MCGLICFSVIDNDFLRVICVFVVTVVWRRLAFFLVSHLQLRLDFTSIATTTVADAAAAAASASFQGQSFGSSPPVGCIIRWDPQSRTSNAGHRARHLPDFPSIFLRTPG